MGLKTATLYYIHDPMCSWCWGFRPTWLRIESSLPRDIEVKYILGGLARDSDQPMPAEMQVMIHNTWKIIQSHIPSVSFNFNFWDKCIPRRSTYPACRAVIAARNQQPSSEQAMIVAIQEAYYSQAKNPSDDSVLIELSKDLSLNTHLFTTDLNSPQTQQRLLGEIHLAQSLGGQGFPSLVLETHNHCELITIDYTDPSAVLEHIASIDR